MSESGSSGSSRAAPPQWPSAPETQRTAAEKARILAHLTVQLAALDMESRDSNGDH